MMMVMRGDPTSLTPSYNVPLDGSAVIAMSGHPVKIHGSASFPVDDWIVAGSCCFELSNQSHLRHEYD